MSRFWKPATCDEGGGKVMDRGPLADRIIQEFDRMPAQLQSAARYVLDRPNDVALLSMREQARQAGVQPATMTRLAQRLGLDGYEAVRAIYAEAIRGGGLGFSGRAGLQLASQKAKGDQALAADIVESLAGEVRRLAEPATLSRLAAAAALLADAERIYCLGLRSCYPVAWSFWYVLSLLGERTVLLDAPGDVGSDRIRSARDGDVLLAVSVEPYTRATVEIASYASQQGVPVIAITDSEVSPLARLARAAILVSATGPSFFNSMTPAFAVGEIMAAIVAGRGGDASLEALRHTEAQLTTCNVHWRAAAPRRV